LIDTLIVEQPAGWLHYTVTRAV